MFLAAILAYLVFGAMVNTLPLKTSSLTESSLLIKSSAVSKITKSISSSKPVVSFSKSSKQAVSFTAPLVATLSTVRVNTSNVKLAPHVKSAATSSVTHKRAVPPAAPMIAITKKSVDKEPSTVILANIVLASLETTPYDAATYDYDEPEDLKNPAPDDVKQIIKPEGYVDEPVDVNKQLKPKKSIYPNEEKSENFLKEIKNNLQRGNADYDEKNINLRRRMNIDVAWPNPVNFKSRKSSNNTHNKQHSKQVHQSALSNHVAESTKHKYRRIGLTTPNKYQNWPHKKQKKHKRLSRPNAALRLRRLKHEKHRNRISDIEKEKKENYHVQRRRDRKMNTKQRPIARAEGKSMEITLPADLISDLMLQANPVKEQTLDRPRWHPQYVTSHTTTSTATRPSLYDFYTKSTPHDKSSTITNTSPSSQLNHTFNIVKQLDAKAANVVRFNKKIARNLEGSLTTPSAFEIDSSKKQKKLERFVKFVKKNRSLLRQFIADKKGGKAAARAGKSGYFRGHGGRPHQVHMPHPHHAEPPHAHQLDLSPGKGNRIELLRGKGRLCQRNVMIPEGPKYNSLGAIYMPEFQQKKGAPDYPATKKSRFIIPICCNCCKKSVLGCE